MTYETLKIEKGLYNTGKSFTQALEELDPSENYKGTSLEGLDAYERQLKRFDIKVSGKDCDTVSKFFATTDSAALFPEFVSRSIQLGALSDQLLDKVIAQTTYIDSLDYRSVQLVDNIDITQMQEIAQGADLTATEIKVKETLTSLKKYGRIISASYEAIKYQKLDVFSLVLRRIGEQIMRREFFDAIIAVCGDNMDVIRTSGAEVAYEDLVNLWTSMNPYNLTTMIVAPTMYAAILKLPEFRDATAGLDFHATGRVITPFGAEIVPCTGFDEDKILGIDRNYAVERVVASDITTEYDKLINCQLERATVSTTVGFSPIFSDAVKVLQLKG